MLSDSDEWTINRGTGDIVATIPSDGFPLNPSKRWLMGWFTHIKIIFPKLCWNVENLVHALGWCNDILMSGVKS